MQKVNEVYEGKKIRLRRFKEDDATHVLKLWNNLEVRKYLANFFPFSLENELEFIRSQNKAFDQRKSFTFAIETLAEKKLIGGCGLHDVNWRSRNAELGITIFDQDYWNKGFGTDAMIVLLNFGFHILNLNNIYLRVLEYNKRAIRVYEKIGFKHVGKFRKFVYFGGKFYDLLIMDLLIDEFKHHLPWAKVKDDEKQ